MMYAATLGTPKQMKLGLQIHAASFVAGVLLMLVINLLTGAPYWIAWVVLGWGIGLLSHWLSVRNHIRRDSAAGRVS